MTNSNSYYSNSKSYFNLFHRIKPSLFLLTLIFIFYYLFVLKNFDKMYYNIKYFINPSPTIIFLPTIDLLFLLQDDNDNYYKTFTQNDLRVRNVKNIDEYKQNIKQSVYDLNDNEKYKINESIKIITKKFDNVNVDNNYEYFDGKKANRIPWKIGSIKGELYEVGHSHTRNNVIILSKEFINNSNTDNLVELLIHEKVHVYQKMYPKDTDVYLQKNNFVKTQRKTEKTYRANPDTNEWIYNDNDQIYEAVYNDNPSSINDVTFASKSIMYEHPFEKMAYELQDI